MELSEVYMFMVKKKKRNKERKEKKNLKNSSSPHFLIAQFLSVVLCNN